MEREGPALDRRVVNPKNEFHDNNRKGKDVSKQATLLYLANRSSRHLLSVHQTRIKRDDPHANDRFLSRRDCCDILIFAAESASLWEPSYWIRTENHASCSG